jgi:ribosomal subunit interface protein
MKLSVFLKDVDESPEAQALIEKKCKRLQKYVDSKTNVKWNCIHKQGSYQIEASIIGPQFVYHAHAESFNFGESVDKTIGKLEKQLVKKVQKWKNHHKEGVRHRDLEILDPEEAWADHDEDNYDDAA